MHRELITEIFRRNNPEEIECVKKILIRLIDDLKVEDRDEYEEIEYKLYTLLYGDHLNEHLARKWVEDMENEDGTVGEHWTYEQTSQYAGNHNKWDYYAVLNMVYSDYYNAKFDTNIYVFLANKFLDDKDGSKDKALRYYFDVVK